MDPKSTQDEKKWVPEGVPEAFKKESWKKLVLGAPRTLKKHVFPLVFHCFCSGQVFQKTTQKGTNMETKWIQNLGQDRPGTLRERGQKIDQKSLQNGAQKGAKIEAQWEPDSMKKGCQKQSRLQEESRGAPGSLLGPFWEQFWSIFRYFLCFPMCFLQLSFENLRFPMCFYTFCHAFSASFWKVRFSRFSGKLRGNRLAKIGARKEGERERGRNIQS